MKLTYQSIWTIALTLVIALLGTANIATAQETGFFVDKPEGTKSALAPSVLTCKANITSVIDVADEAARFTPAIFGTGPGGGEGGQFDPTPVLTVRDLTLKEGQCLNAHLSVIAGSAQTYGVAPLALFQVTLTPVNGGPQHMVGHYETPYGIPSPAVALEAEKDVDMLAANFFQKVGYDEHEVRPGTYTVDVWWAGAPPGVPGGSLGAAFVLKLYM